MTMKRSDKARHEATLKSTGRRGYTDCRFASPTRQAAARADRGHEFMTRAEYATHMIGRRAKSPTMVEFEIARRGEIHRQQRIIGGRRVTGMQPGTKRPSRWAHAGDVRRCVRAR